MSKKRTQDGVSCLKAIIRLANGNKTTHDRMTDGARDLATVAINQIESFLPTHFLVSQYITKTLTVEWSKASQLIGSVIQQSELANTLTNEFEKLHSETNWKDHTEDWDTAVIEWLISKENTDLRGKIRMIFFE